MVLVGVVAVEEAAEADVDAVEFPKALDWKVEKLAAPLIAKTMPVQHRGKWQNTSVCDTRCETCLVDSGWLAGSRPRRGLYLAPGIERRGNCLLRRPRQECYDTDT